MTEYSHSSSRLRRQPKQQRGKERVEKILDAAAAVFDEVGYSEATTHLIAAKAGTAIGSLYQFFPDKAAIFNAMRVVMPIGLRRCGRRRTRRKSFSYRCAK